jgi:Formate--tetrahydrofolate ligase
MMLRNSLGTPLDNTYKQENLELTEKGCDNLQHHITNLRKFGVPVVVAVNKFTTDTDGEIEIVRKKSLEAGAHGLLLPHSRSIFISFVSPNLFVCLFIYLNSRSFMYTLGTRRKRSQGACGCCGRRLQATR